MPRCRQRGWKCLVLLAVAAMANGKDSECKGNQILEMIEDYAPQCIEACEEVCQPLGGLIMSVFAGEMDAATLICPDWQTFSCMAKTPLILSHCTPLLDAALIYVGIDLPRSDQELRQLCGITSSSTVTVTSTSLPSLPEVVPEPEPPEPAPNPPEATETAATAATAATAGSEAGTAGSGAETAGTGENSLSVQSVAEPSTPSSADAPNTTNTSTSTATTTLFVTETETSTVTATVTETTTHTVTESTTASTTTLAAFGTVDTVLDGASGLSAPWLLLASCIWIWR